MLRLSSRLPRSFSSSRGLCGAFPSSPYALAPLCGLRSFSSSRADLFEEESSSEDAEESEAEAAAQSPVTSVNIHSMLNGEYQFLNRPRPSLAQVVPLFNDRISQENLLQAHEGDREAMILVGQIMLSKDGFGVIKRDPEKGKAWLTRAARKGSVGALDMLSRIAQLERAQQLQAGARPPEPKAPQPGGNSIWSNGCRTRNTPKQP